MTYTHYATPVVISTGIATCYQTKDGFEKNREYPAERVHAKDSDHIVYKVRSDDGKVFVFKPDTFHDYFDFISL